MYLYYNTGAGYPSSDVWNTAATSGNQITCGAIPIMRVPKDPSNDSVASYSYTQGLGAGSAGCGGTVYPNYKFQFTTEGDTSLGPPGIYYLSGLAGLTTIAPY